jgi:hypothetical protein
MRLFDDFEAVRFSEENLIFITKRGFIYYIYDPKYNHWSKYRYAGNDHITVANYQDISKKELTEALDGTFPIKETVFIRRCHISQLDIRDMLKLFKEDYPNYMSDRRIYNAVLEFLLESDICHKSYLKITELFEEALASRQDNGTTLNKIKEACLSVIGRDIFKKEIGIIDGHHGSFFFWIKPVRVIDYSNTNSVDCVAEMMSNEISIEEDDVAQYLTPFLNKYFDNELEANKNRVENCWSDDDVIEQTKYISGFQEYLMHNFFTYESIEKILDDMRNTVLALSSGIENEYIAQLREKRGKATYQLLYAKNLSKEQINEYNANRPTEDDTEKSLIIDFYNRFIYRMEYMMRVGKEKGYDLISFMGP